MIELTMDEPSRRQGDRPRAEPEILPPERPHQRGARGDSGIWSSIETPAGERIYIARPGTAGFMLGAIGIGVVLGIVLLALLGAFLISLPVIGAIAGAIVLSTLIRRYLRSFR